MADRIQKIIARAGLLSRRAAEQAIREGRVTLNGQMVTLGDVAEVEKDHIKLDGKRVPPPPAKKRYVLLHKPRGFICTSSDPEGRPTVLELLPVGMRKGVVPVGRLDFMTEGLLLLTDDGDLAQKVAHPRYKSSKTYHVKVRGCPTQPQVEKLRGGVWLESGKTRPAVIQYLRKTGGDEPNTWWEVILYEGKTRQIREMFQRVGHPVAKLRRVAIGDVRDPDLARGAWRELTPREVELLQRDAGRHVGSESGPKAKGAGSRRPGPGGRKPGTGRKKPSGGGRKRGGGGTGPGPKKGKGPGSRSEKGAPPKSAGDGTRGRGATGRGGSSRGGPSGRGSGSKKGGGAPSRRGPGRPGSKGGGRGR